MFLVILFLNVFQRTCTFRRSRTEWSDFLNRSPERFNIQLPDLPSAKDQHYVGYAVRYLRPEVTKSWRVSLSYLLLDVQSTAMVTTVIQSPFLFVSVQRISILCRRLRPAATKSWNVSVFGAVKACLLAGSYKV